VAEIVGLTAFLDPLVDLALGKRKPEHKDVGSRRLSYRSRRDHPFYQKLNELLAEAKFDKWIEERCPALLFGHLGRPSIPPGVYFRMILVGYFEGIASQRGIRLALQ